MDDERKASSKQDRLRESICYLLDFHMKKICEIARGDMELVEEVELLSMAVDVLKHLGRSGFDIVRHHLCRVQGLRKGDGEMDIHMRILEHCIEFFCR